MQVFPYEYQRALRQLAEQDAKALAEGNKENGAGGDKSTTNVTDSTKDIEETVVDTEMEKKKLDKTRLVTQIGFFFSTLENTYLSTF